MASAAVKRTRSWPSARNSQWIRIQVRGVVSQQSTARTRTKPLSCALAETIAVGVVALDRVTFAARMSRETNSHAREVVSAVEMHALHQAASAASPRARGVRGTPSARALNAGRRVWCARSGMVPRSSVRLVISAAVALVLPRVTCAARMHEGMASHARAMAVVAVEMHAMHLVASAASRLGWP